MRMLAVVTTYTIFLIDYMSVDDLYPIDLMIRARDFSPLLGVVVCFSGGVCYPLHHYQLSV